MPWLGWLEGRAKRTPWTGPLHMVSAAWWTQSEWGQEVIRVLSLDMDASTVSFLLCYIRQAVLEPT